MTILRSTELRPEQKKALGARIHFVQEIQNFADNATVKTFLNLFDGERGFTLWNTLKSAKKGPRRDIFWMITNNFFTPKELEDLYLNIICNNEILVE